MAKAKTLQDIAKREMDKAIKSRRVAHAYLLRLDPKSQAPQVGTKGNKRAKAAAS